MGAKDFLDPLGYVIMTCQRCGNDAPFAVFQAKRKVTFYAVPTISLKEQMVVECRSCEQRFSVPPGMRQDFMDHLLGEEEVATRIRGSISASRAVAKPKGPTFYQILQVDVAADPEVIEAAFRRLALKYHPDRSSDPEAPAKMRLLLEAKAVLSDPAQRMAYDRSLGIVRRPPAIRADEI
ncbi:MAG: DnaJ domain-containing protein [Thermomicrobiales bacterium]|nr:DnaJ domain-containing protein [Thermomicrobiales bacterium]